MFDRNIWTIQQEWYLAQGDCLFRQVSRDIITKRCLFYESVINNAITAQQGYAKNSLLHIS